MRECLCHGWLGGLRQAPGRQDEGEVGGGGEGKGLPRPCASPAPEGGSRGRWLAAAS